MPEGTDWELEYGSRSLARRIPRRRRVLRLPRDRAELEAKLQQVMPRGGAP